MAEIEPSRSIQTIYRYRCLRLGIVTQQDLMQLFTNTDFNLETYYTDWSFE